jgi:hypothetical protein
MGNREIELLTSLPAGTKPTGGRRADVRPDDWDYLIGTKGGRFWWRRSMMCPCQGNSQTDQADPTCTYCKGTGYIYFMPDPMAKTGDVDKAGVAIEIDDGKIGISVQAWVSSVTYDTQIFERFGQWIYGTSLLTTSRHNRIGYRDMLEARDQTIMFSQLVVASGNSEIVVTGHRSRKGLWTKVQSVNVLRSLSKIYDREADYRVTDDGTIEWLTTPPTSGTLIAVHAAFHPRWIVMDFPFASRDTLVQKKTTASAVADQFTRLPMRAMVKLDFLANNP